MMSQRAGGVLHRGELLPKSSQKLSDLLTGFQRFRVETLIQKRPKVTLQPEKMTYIHFVFRLNILQTYTAVTQTIQELISLKLHFMYLLVIQKITSKNCLGIISRKIAFQLHKKCFRIYFRNHFSWCVLQTSEKLSEPFPFLVLPLHLSPMMIVARDL